MTGFYIRLTEVGGWGTRVGRRWEIMAGEMGTDWTANRQYSQTFPKFHGHMIFANNQKVSGADDENDSVKNRTLSEFSLLSTKKLRILSREN